MHFCFSSFQFLLAHFPQISLFSFTCWFQGEWSRQVRLFNINDAVRNDKIIEVWKKEYTHENCCTAVVETGSPQFKCGVNSKLTRWSYTSSISIHLQCLPSLHQPNCNNQRFLHGSSWVCLFFDAEFPTANKVKCTAGWNRGVLLDTSWYPS